MKQHIYRISHKFIIGLSFFLCISFSLTAQAWDATGHIIIAKIAQDSLTPIAKQDINELIDATSFATSFPRFTPYIYSASWPDYYIHNVKVPKGIQTDLLNTLINITQDWHYTDTPFVINNITPKPVSVNNSVWATNYLMHAIPELIKKKNYNQAAYYLVFLTHIVGDIHQPLHDSDFYSSAFPNSDMGGNLYNINGPYGITELHALWDESLGRFNNWPNFSPNAGYRPPVDNILMYANAFEQFCYIQNDLEPSNWEKESHQIAVNFVYPVNNEFAPKIDGTPSPTYITEGRHIAATQMCLAGKRLAAILDNIFTAPLYSINIDPAMKHQRRF